MATANILIEFMFDEGGDAVAVLPQCVVDSFFGLVVYVVDPPEDGVTGYLCMIHADDSD